MVRHSCLINSSIENEFNFAFEFNLQCSTRECMSLISVVQMVNQFTNRTQAGRERAKGASASRATSKSAASYSSLTTVKPSRQNGKTTTERSVPSQADRPEAQTCATRAADGGELDTPIAFSRLQLVSDDAVLTKIAATSDSGGWDGAADARYLLDADRRAIAKAAEGRAAEPLTSKKTDGRPRRRRRPSASRRRTRRGRAQLRRRNWQTNTHAMQNYNEGAQLSRCRKFNATPSGIMSHVNGNILIVPTTDGNINVGPQHQLYRQLLQRYQVRRNDPSKVSNDRTDNSDDDNIKPTTAWAA
jgi:hypothetical protein